jgi:hypothetical protein
LLKAGKRIKKIVLFFYDSAFIFYKIQRNNKFSATSYISTGWADGVQEGKSKHKYYYFLCGTTEGAAWSISLYLEE